MKNEKTASPAVILMLFLLAAAVVTYFGVTVSASWDGGLTDGNEESTPLPFPRGNAGENEVPLPGSETVPGEEGTPHSYDETGLPESDPTTGRGTDRVTEAASDTFPETTGEEKRAGLSFWAVLGAAGCAAAVAAIVLAVTNKAEKKH